MHAVGGAELSLDSRDLREVLGGLGLASPEGVALVREALRQGEAQLGQARAAAPPGGA
ncbi:MAG: hypothetical protein HY744_31575 [Deltaproteobacteria bacterium]|nr:hypothetical protein [Deltaproteobacteria bacterium]